MVNIELIEGTLISAGGYRINDTQHIGNKHEAQVDEARKIAYATGRKIEEVLIQILPINFQNASEENTL
ncbi:MAG TPA: hypothetical protein VMV48_13710 [Gallionellaceae bacterium]|nr:hypothetical protein [Gallionellaceae bacterium]